MSEGFEWDDANTNHIWQRHRVRPQEAEEAVDDLHAVPIDALVVDEPREEVIGITPAGRLLAVVFTLRGERLWLVTARPATSRERRLYWRRP
jgi:uncharacterized DUF497 family protein